jgi:hypothetical protein
MLSTVRVLPSMLVGCLLLMMARPLLAQTEAAKPWVDDFARFANSSREKTWIVGHSTMPCLSETEAFDAACRDGSAQLLARLRPRLARAYGAESEAWLMRRLGQELSAGGALIADRSVSRVHRPYGDIWSEAILVDASSARLAQIAGEHAVWSSGRQHFRRSAAASIIGMSLAILLIYAVVNAVTKGYFRGYLRTTAAAAMMLCVIGAWYVIRGAG